MLPVNPETAMLGHGHIPLGRCNYGSEVAWVVQCTAPSAPKCLAGTATTCPSCKWHFIGLVARIIPRLIKHCVGGKPLFMQACTDMSSLEEDKKSSPLRLLGVSRGLCSDLCTNSKMNPSSLLLLEWSRCQSCRTHS